MVRRSFLDGPFPRAFAHRGWHLGDLTSKATRDGVVVVLHDAMLDREQVCGLVDLLEELPEALLTVTGGARARPFHDRVVRRRR